MGLFDSLEPTILDRQGKMRVTVYGPHGDFKRRLLEISRSIRADHGFSDTYAVIERMDFRARLPGETSGQYFKQKSYHYVANSDVNLFLFYCYQYNDSADLEFKEMCDNIKWKISCSAVFKDVACKMPMLLKGEITDARVLVEPFDSKCKDVDKKIIDLAVARCYNFLKVKYYKVGQF